MPCRDERDHEYDRQQSVENLHRAQIAEASLCAVLRACEENGGVDALMPFINFDEAGVTKKEFEKWWFQHQKRDYERREQERIRKEKEELVAKAKAKLSPEELEALLQRGR